MKNLILSLLLLIPCLCFGKQYEYCTIEAREGSLIAHRIKEIKIHFGSDSVLVNPKWKSIEDAANYLGEQGFELITTDVISSDFVWHYLYFKREKESAKKESEK